MKFEIDFNQASTIRGLIWLTVSAIGLIMIMAGKDISELLLLGSAVAGGLGVAVKD
jgi:hypothetical protein